MTFSIAGRCTRTGRFGIAISSSSPAVAARCAHLRAGVGAACSQNVTDPRLGQALLDRLAAGDAPGDAVAAIVAAAGDLSAYRQLTVIGASGQPAAYSGAEALGRYGVSIGVDCVAAGNLLASDRVPEAMTDVFDTLPNSALGDRLITALRAGLDSGGEEGPVHSAGLVMVADLPWNATDLRVDWSDDPVGDLEKVWRLWRPLEAGYLTRAVDPSAAPSYGVPGEKRP